MRSLCLLCFSLLLATAAAAESVRTITVDSSIQDAIDQVPLDNHERVVIEIPNGHYNERLRLDQSRVTLRGESRGGVTIHFNFPREEYHKRYDRFGAGVVNLYGDDCVLEHLTIDNTQPTHEHAFAIYGQPNRVIIDDCRVVGEGGDTLSLWNTAHGMYYHRNCEFRGAVDFVCPRGWCFVRDSKFYEVLTTAAIWHDGHMDPAHMKFVLTGCEFDGVQDFWLGRNHYPSQFYLLGCRFAKTMADRPIGVVKDLSNVPEEDRYQWERKYFYDCHRDGGDYAWHADNLDQAAGSPTPDQITPAWTFDGRWDPESQSPPEVVEVETHQDKLYVRFSEPVAGAVAATVTRADGGQAELISGDGTARLVFAGGNEDSAPATLNGESLYGCHATLAMRRLGQVKLPETAPRRDAVILVIGDSTVADYAAKSTLQGWGWGLRKFLDDRSTVINAAANGRSSESFRSEGRWERGLAEAKAAGGPHYVFIQFGHNDNLGKGPGRETDPAPGGSFRANLRRYIAEARDAGAVPVLLTPPRRRLYDEGTDRLRQDVGNAPYAEAARAVAAEEGVTLVDLRAISEQLFNDLGPVTAARLQTEGDATHFSPAGARELASRVLQDLCEQMPGFERYVVEDRLARP
ncbi:putative rhamnogalacturonan acetylesterase YesY [Posidoniimonas polymericola]|uniref:Putative rhamnogalacturonan acetylesterase YesY n=1 Tax=Posidoniimonas polymericola TaxID=2528002 RepID=A0A5C5ZEG3_9BACT|nr:pectinesterase family protein [Posidoniimonas polymericola]TWT85546.1 putative rhamnogalacturonan acetylesterase YesY [Posidoniimonas polymericola]